MTSFFSSNAKILELKEQQITFFFLLIGRLENIIRGSQSKGADRRPREQQDKKKRQTQDYVVQATPIHKRPRPYKLIDYKNFLPNCLPYRETDFGQALQVYASSLPGNKQGTHKLKEL